MPGTVFEQQIKKTLAFEGGYVDDPNDAGGETNFGISKRSYPDVDIANLTEAEAIAIYKRDWWDKPRLGRLDDVVAAKVFDLSVNMGLRQASRLLQRAVNALNGNLALDTDGVIGTDTVKAARALDAGELVKEIRNQAVAFYTNLARNKPSQSVYLNGWLRRARA